MIPMVPAVVRRCKVVVTLTSARSRVAAMVKKLIEDTDTTHNRFVTEQLRQTARYMEGIEDVMDQLTTMEDQPDASIDQNQGER